MPLNSHEKRATQPVKTLKPGDALDEKKDMGQPATSKQDIWFRRGEIIFKAGDPATHIYMVQSGLISVVTQRKDKNIELSQVPASQLLGAEALWGSPTWLTTAIASNEAQLLPLEIAQARAMLDGGAPLIKLL